MYLNDKWLLVLTSVLCIVILPAFGAEIEIPAGSSSNDCGNDCFTPDAVRIKVNDEITWFNNDTSAHTVTSGTDTTADGLFDSGILMPKNSITYVFESEGEYPYYCAVHPWMKGTILVGVDAHETRDSPKISLYTSQDNYNAGDTITVFGSVNEKLDDVLVNLYIITANGNLVTVKQLEVSEDNTYETEILADGPLWRSNGEYTVKVKYGAETTTAETTFGFDGTANETHDMPLPNTQNEDLYEKAKNSRDSLAKKEDQNLQEKVDNLRDSLAEAERENSELKDQVKVLRQKIDGLNAIINEQIKVIYQWVVSR